MQEDEMDSDDSDDDGRPGKKNKKKKKVVKQANVSSSSSLTCRALSPLLTLFCFFFRFRPDMGSFRNKGYNAAKPTAGKKKGRKGEEDDE
jgi:hypothetical protein